jgi:hypothetical protein
LSATWRYSFNLVSFCPSELEQRFIITAMELHKKHNFFWKRSYGGGGLSDALLGNGEFIANRVVAHVRRAVWPTTKYTIRGKVVASPKFGPWWILCVRVTCGSS